MGDDYLLIFSARQRLDRVLKAGFEISIWKSPTAVPQFRANATSSSHWTFGEGDSATHALMDCIRKVEEHLKEEGK